MKDQCSSSDDALQLLRAQQTYLNLSLGIVVTNVLVLINEAALRRVQMGNLCYLDGYLSQGG